MVLLIQNSELYNNDIRAMIMAFFSGVKIVTDVDKVSKETLELDPLDFYFRVTYEKDSTTIELGALQENTNVCEQATFMERIEGDFQEKKIFRNPFKRALYHVLSQKAGRTLPWGDLTGVRPTKIAMNELTRGKSFDEAVSHYETEYETTNRKAILATTVAENELRLVKTLDLEQGYCLYVGIPFCPSRCLYCSFTSYPIAKYQEQATVYVEKLCEEIDYLAKLYAGRKLLAVYMGGGTPTSISHELLDKLLGKIREAFCLDDSKDLLEFTVEAGRPDSITIEKLQVMKKHGVSRISINPQTMNDATLATIGRAHTSAQTKDAFLLARSCGFDNINMDLIAGLPGEDLAMMRNTLNEIRKLDPESITVHSLAIKRAANLRQQMDVYGASINQEMDAMHNLVYELATELSMEPYYLYRQKNIGGNLENVGYAKKGTECLYNILIMEELTDILAAGAGASTKLVFNARDKEAHPENYRVERIENCKSVDDYILRFDEMMARKDVLKEKK